MLLKPEIKNGKTLLDLKADILRLQGYKSLNDSQVNLRLGRILDHFPNMKFPVGCIHELVTTCNEETAATSGFLTGLLSSISKDGDVIIWISSSFKLFPPALPGFRLSPEHLIFIEVKDQKQAIWTMEETLRCEAISVVVCEMPGLSFEASRRFQLAVEHSKATGFVIHHNSPISNTTACSARWKISSLRSEVMDGLPGLGNPRWKVELLRVRNGKPGTWNVQWLGNEFEVERLSTAKYQEMKQKVG